MITAEENKLSVSHDLKKLQLEMKISSTVCPDGVIGSRVRLKIESRKGWRFDSSSGHINKKPRIYVVFCLMIIHHYRHHHYRHYHH